MEIRLHSSISKNDPKNINAKQQVFRLMNAAWHSITVMTVATDFHRTSLSSANVCKQNRTAKYLLTKSISHTPPFVKGRSENSKKREMTLEVQLWSHAPRVISRRSWYLTSFVILSFFEYALCLFYKNPNTITMLSKENSLCFLRNLHRKRLKFSWLLRSRSARFRFGAKHFLLLYI